MKLSKKLRRLSAVLILIPLAGCSTPAIAPVADPIDICETWKQINVRKSDVLSAETARSVVENNVGREALGCPYEEPPKPKQRVATRATS